MRFLYALIIVLAVLIGVIFYFPVKNFKKNVNSETINLRTKDGVEIIGDYYPSTSSGQDGMGALLLHMMPADRKSWTEFAANLQEAGFKVLAIDLRGHGDSEGGPIGYKRFSDEEHQASKFDVEAAAEFLKSKGVQSLHLVGASIGANLALQYLSEHPEAKSAVLLSPGLDYRGLKTEPLVSKVKSSQAVYFAGSSEDMRSSGQSATEMIEALYGLCNCKKDIKKFDNAGHGTIIFETNPGFVDEITEWLSKIK